MSQKHPEEVPFYHDDCPDGFTVDAEEFRRLINAVSAIVDECRMHVHPDGIRVIAHDPANVVMVEAETSEVEVERPVVFGINLNHAIEAIERMDAEVGPSVNNTYYFEILSDSRVIQLGHPSMENEAAIFDPSTVLEDPSPPEDLDITTEFSAPAYRFKAVVGSMGKMADSYLVLTPSDGELQLEGYDGSFSSDEDSESPVCEWSLEADVEPGKDVAFSAAYLEEVASGLPYEGTVNVSFGSPAPIIVESDLGVTYHQAPRIRPKEFEDDTEEGEQ